MNIIGICYTLILTINCYLIENKNNMIKLLKQVKSK